MRIGGWLAVLALTAVVFSGCMEATTEVMVRPDGSGTITSTVFPSPQMAAMMAQSEESPLKIKPEKVEEQAKQLGEGVTVASAENITDKQGREGAKVVFAFEDISKVSLQANPMGGMGPGESKASEQLAFGFEPGSPAVLTVKLPFNAEKEGAEDAPAPGPGQGPGGGPSPAEVAQAKQFMDGMRLWLRLRVEGEISETNAAYVNKKRDGVSLMDMNFDALVDNEKQFQAFMAHGKTDSLADAKAVAEEFDAIRMEPAEVVTVRFE